MKTGKRNRIQRVLTVEPLVELLQRELAAAGLAAPPQEPSTAHEFTNWYLEAVQRLQAYCAAEDAQAPMSRDEVALMCRACLSTSTLEESMNTCAAFTRMLLPRAGKADLLVDQQRASFQFDSLWGNATNANSLVDITGLFAFLQLFQWLVGHDFPVLQVGIGPLERDDVLPFLKLFNAPVMAGGDLYSFEFPREALLLPVARTPREFDAFFAVFPCAVLENTRHTLEQKTTSMLTAAIRQGVGVPRQHELASALGMPLSTYRKSLESSGSSYRELKTRCLKDSAFTLLQQQDMSIHHIADLLDFSDTGTFRRAFRQWTGLSPTQWRAQQADKTPLNAPLT